MKHANDRAGTVLYSLRVQPELLDQLRAIKERDGIPVAEQLRRALALWFAANRSSRIDTLVKRKR